MSQANVKSQHPGLQGIRILLCVSGSIAAFKAAYWARSLVKEEAIVTVLMTGAAKRFIAPLTFSAITGNRVYHDMFEEDPEGVMGHINLSREHDIVLVAPASAQTIGRLSHGMADDLLSTMVLASKKPVVVCPAMNTNMFVHAATQKNISTLMAYGYFIVSPDSGSLACGEEGDGRLPEWDVAREKLLQVLADQDLAGRHVVITAGPTREAVDPARYVTNRSSGKMGYALARTALRRGARVTLISGPVSLEAPPNVELVKVQSAAEMEEAVMACLDDAHVVIKAAAVADFRPADVQRHKIKKKDGTFSLDLVKNNDILARVGKERSKDLVLVGFAAESQHHEEEGRRKLIEKGADLIVVNDILGKKTGFDVETNQVTLIDRDTAVQLPLCSKEQTANHILDRIVVLLPAD